MTVAEVRAYLRVPRSTFYKWMNTGQGPKSIRLPNGERRIRRSDLLEWMQERQAE
ncbi:helix-turn-helix transcriptional regulator [Thermocatellispora tengchongensis]|uniref:helix-turn-helix transcriptional regulator n=1 Tax=Thermocatellispora tengchongensis TaxID=1073253 RepID=UPI001FE58F32|nr:helix-turn-helix domain-containing protein [Thermocatellispora tengchongensis]